MTEAELRDAASAYVYTVWDDEDLVDLNGPAYDYITTGPGQPLLRLIDDRINDLVEALKNLPRH